MKRFLNKIIIIVGIACIIVLLCIVTIIAMRSKNTYDNYINEPDDKLISYYDGEVYAAKKKVTDYTDNSIIDTAIYQICTDNEYSSVEVLESWYDFGLKCDSYMVLFDNNYLYNIIDSNGSAMYVEQDYKLYLELKEE